MGPNVACPRAPKRARRWSGYPQCGHGRRDQAAARESRGSRRPAWVLEPNDWNQLYIIARGRTTTYIVNGHTASVLFDDHPTMFNDHGYIAIQLEGRGANKASFRNLWLKNLP